MVAGWVHDFGPAKMKFPQDFTRGAASSQQIEAAS
jgi:hypothetical protein